MKKITIGSLFAALAFGLPAQDAVSARAAYQERQALAEVPRLVQQFDQLAANQDEIVQRLLKVEAGSSTEAALRAEIESLRAEIAELKASLRREQDAMRREIVADLAKRISTLTPPPPPAPAAPAVATRPPASSRPAPAAQHQPPPPVEIGPHYEYIVEKGQTLSLIAEGFGTTVQKILAANPGLKPNMLRVGQKLIIPAEDVPPPPKKGGKGKK